MYQLKILMSAHSLFYSSSTHFSHKYPTRSSLFDLPTPFFTSTAGEKMSFLSIIIFMEQFTYKY